jgi:hypothetical protein
MFYHHHHVWLRTKFAVISNCRCAVLLLDFGGKSPLERVENKFC